MTIDLDAANRHAAKRRRQRERTNRKVEQMHERVQRRRQRRDRIRLLALLTGSGVLRCTR